MTNRFALFRRTLQREWSSCLAHSAVGRFARWSVPPLLEIDTDGKHAAVLMRGKPVGRIALEDILRDLSLLGRLRGSRSRPLHLLVPSSWTLERRMTLPEAARENLRQVVSYELDRISPFEPDQVFFVFEEVSDGGDADQIALHVWLLPRKRVTPWLDALRRAAIQVGSVATRERPQRNFLPKALRDRPAFLQRLVAVLPAAAAAVLLAAFLAAPLWWNRQQLQESLQQERVLQHQAQEAAKLQRRLERRLSVLDQIARRWSDSPDPLEILTLLTRLLPDDTYLQELEIKEHRVRLRGFSSQASALIGRLEQSPRFEHPRFLSPVTQQAGKELFQLVVTYVPAAEEKKG